MVHWIGHGLSDLLHLLAVRIPNLTADYPLVLVTWEDTTCMSAWQDKKELLDFATNHKWLCSNVGYLVYEDTESVTLAARLNNDGEYFGLAERISRRAIIEIKTLSA